uniref:Isoform 2 of 18.0 kDa class II heat shock protein n=1 Tax=Oryza sativa subsp. japonica TaxID=39947 RepID=Q5VRY1-2
MESAMFGLETPLMTALQHLLDIPDGEGGAAGKQGATGGPTRAYVRDARAMAATPADVKDLPGAYAFVEEKEESCKYLRMERRMGKFMRKFVLPDNADVDKISAVCQDGVLTVTVEKLPPPEPKKPKTIEVKVA